MRNGFYIETNQSTGELEMKQKNKTLLLTQYNFSHEASHRIQQLYNKSLALSNSY